MDYLVYSVWVMGNGLFSLLCMGYVYLVLALFPGSCMDCLTFIAAQYIWLWPSGLGPSEAIHEVIKLDHMPTCMNHRKQAGFSISGSHFRLGCSRHFNFLWAAVMRRVDGCLN